MNQAIDTGDDLRKGAEGGQRHDLDGNDIADLIHGLNLLPGIVLGLLVDEGHAVILAVDILYGDLNGIADGNDLSRALDAQPGQVGQADTAIHAAQIHKGTEVG